MDYPSKEAIDKLTDEEMIEIWVNSPVGYLRNSSSIAAHFTERFIEKKLDTSEVHKKMLKVYTPKLKDFSDRNPEKMSFIDNMFLGANYGYIESDS